MRSRILPLLLAGAAPLATAAEPSLVLNQRLQFQFDRWQQSYAADATQTLATYDLETATPVFAYRLGTLVLNSSLEYNRYAYGDMSVSSLGVNRYGFRMGLFPYRPFRVFLDYQHNTSPDYLGGGRVMGNTYGAGFRYAGRRVQDVQVSYRRGENRLKGDTDAWSLLKLDANQRIGQTMVQFRSSRQTYHATDFQDGWKLTIATLDTDTSLSGNWTFRTRTQGSTTAGHQWFDTGASLSGVLDSLTSLTTLSLSQNLAPGLRTRSVFASQSVTSAEGPWTSYLTAAFNRSLTSGQGQGAVGATVALGQIYRLTPEWRIHGSVGLTSNDQTFANVEQKTNTVSLNLGTSRGGDIPKLLQHTLFFLSDQNFERRIREDYPPDYMPNELAGVLLRRRMRQSGEFGFTTDLWHVSSRGGEGKLDWAQITGHVQTLGNLQLFLVGDWRHDDQLNLPGLLTEESSATFNGSLAVGNASQVLGSAGFSGSRQRVDPAMIPPAAGGAAVSGEARSHWAFFSVGGSSRIFRMPAGVLVTRFIPSTGAGMTTLTAHADLRFREISMRLVYESLRQDNGLKSSRISFNLLRIFDTVAFGGGW